MASLLQKEKKEKEQKLSPIKIEISNTENFIDKFAFKRGGESNRNNKKINSNNDIEHVA